MTVDRAGVMEAARQLLQAIGEDPDREGLRETPRRVADMWSEFIDYDAGRTDTTFQSVSTDQLVVVRGMRVWSLCEHHLLPFWCDVAVGYIAKERVIGLSKIARVAHAHAHRLQIQERLVDHVADDIGGIAGSPHVAVIAKGEHLCMTMRGIRTSALMISSAMRGAFRDDPRLRAEFMALAE